MTLKRSRRLQTVTEAEGLRNIHFDIFWLGKWLSAMQSLSFVNMSTPGFPLKKLPQVWHFTPLDIGYMWWSAIGISTFYS